MTVGGAGVYKEKRIGRQNMGSPFDRNQGRELGRGFGEKWENGEEAERLVDHGRNQGVFEERVVFSIG